MFNGIEGTSVSIKVTATFTVEAKSPEAAEWLLRYGGVTPLDELTLELDNVELDDVEAAPEVPWLMMGPDPFMATCRRCGRSEPQCDLPNAIDVLVKYMAYISARHAACE